MSGITDLLFDLSALLRSDPDAGKLHTRHLLALRAVCEHWRPIAIVTLAELIDATQSTTSRTVDRLVSAGLLQRTESPEDRRSVLLSPTDTGRELNARVRRYTLAVSRHVAAA